MALQHAAPGTIIEVQARDEASGSAGSRTLVRTGHLEIFRYALPAGKVVDTHSAAGVMVVHCLGGTVDFTALGRTQTMTPGTMLYLQDHEPHSLTATSDALLLITILLNRA